MGNVTKILFICAKVVYILMFWGIVALILTSGPKPLVLDQTFGNNNYGYTTEYPNGWITYSPTENLVVISGEPETSAYYSTINIQAVASIENHGIYGTPGDVLKSLKEQLVTGSDDARVFGEKPYRYYTLDEEELDGLQVHFEYTRDGERFKQWQIVLPSISGKVFFTWSYTCPAKTYEKFLPTAQQILDSWRIGDISKES